MNRRTEKLQQPEVTASSNWCPDFLRIYHPPPLYIYWAIIYAQACADSASRVSSEHPNNSAVHRGPATLAATWLTASCLWRGHQPAVKPSPRIPNPQTDHRALTWDRHHASLLQNCRSQAHRFLRNRKLPVWNLPWAPSHGTLPFLAPRFLSWA